MQTDFDKNQPIYQQIIDRITASIAKGGLAPGAKLSSVRDLAAEFKVNPNTMQRSLAKLEEMGYIRTERTSGKYVTQDTALIDAAKTKIPEKITEAFVAEMSDFGVPPGAILRFVNDHIERIEQRGENTGN